MVEVSPRWTVMEWRLDVTTEERKTETRRNYDVTPCKVILGLMSVYTETSRTSSIVGVLTEVGYTLPLDTYVRRTGKLGGYPCQESV